MELSQWFDDLPVIGRRPPQEAAQILSDLGDTQAAALLQQAANDAGAKVESTFSLSDWLRGSPAPWQHTSHTFGYIAPFAGGETQIPIVHAGQVAADPQLKQTRLTITLDALRAADYPGSGEHRILFDFYGQNQVPTGAEDLHFNSTYRVREGEFAAILGFPIFVGLNVGAQGVQLKCFTVNVSNSDDESLLSFMDGDLFKKGLSLATVAQPAIAPLAGLAMALTRSIASRSKNVPVQDFFLGLDFSSVATRARLAIGSYVAVQIPETLGVAWQWSDWIYQPGTARIVAKQDPTRLIPYNYIVLGVSRFEN